MAEILTGSVLVTCEYQGKMYIAEDPQRAEGMHLGKVNSLSPLLWLDVSTIEKVQRDGAVRYVLTEPQRNYPAGTEAFPAGGMHLVEFALEQARKLPKELEGFVVVNGDKPSTHLGAKAARYYYNLQEAAMKAGQARAQTLDL